MFLSIFAFNEFFLIVIESMKEYHKKVVTLKSKEKSLFSFTVNLINDFYSKRSGKGSRKILN